MEEKHAIATVLLLTGAFACSALACMSRRVRDVFFFLLVALLPFAERMAVNYVSREWYRGTTRGFEFCGTDILAFSLLVSSVLFPPDDGRRRFWPASLGLMIIYFFYACFCVAIADPKLFGLFELSKMLRGILVFLAAAFYVRGERELRLLVAGLAVAISCQVLIAFDQRYLQGIDRVPGTLDDSNSLSMYLCTTAPVLVAVMTSRFPKFLKCFVAPAIALAAVGVVLTISRTGVAAMAVALAGATAATISLKITAKKIAISVIVMIAAVGIVAKSWKTIDARFSGDTLKKEYANKHTMNRGYYIRMAIEIMEDGRWFGVGPNNWSYWVSNKYGPKRGWTFVPYHGTDKMPSDIVPSGGNVDEAQAAPAHSLAALTAGEMGIGGLLLLTILWFRWLQIGASFLWPRTADPLRRMGVGLFFGLCGTFFQSITEWVFHQTPIFFTFNVMLGALASLYALKKSGDSGVGNPDPEMDAVAPSSLDPRFSTLGQI